MVLLGDWSASMATWFMTDSVSLGHYYTIYVIYCVYHGYVLEILKKFSLKIKTWVACSASLC